MAEEAPAASAITVNGRGQEIRTEPDTPLLYVLRNHLGLKGTRFGCGLGVCGACLVLVDGHPAYSCDTPMWSVDGKDVTTVEGLGADGEPHPVARSIVAQQAAQCGYCMSGIVVRAAHLLDREPAIRPRPMCARPSMTTCAAAARTTAWSAPCLRPRPRCGSGST